MGGSLDITGKIMNGGSGAQKTGYQEWQEQGLVIFDHKYFDYNIYQLSATNCFSIVVLLASVPHLCTFIFGNYKWKMTKKQLTSENYPWTTTINLLFPLFSRHSYSCENDSILVGYDSVFGF